jgi:hypothetical protein
MICVTSRRVEVMSSVFMRAGGRTKTISASCTTL